MNLFSKTQTEIDNSRSTTLTTPPHVLPSYSEAAAKLDEVLRQQHELEAQLAQAIDRMNKACEGRAIPPWDHDREVNTLTQQITTHKAKIHEAEAAVRDAEGRARIEVSRRAKPAHDELRRRVIRALEELRDALEAERLFRADMDNRDVLSSAVITAVRVLDLDHDTLEAIIEGQKGHLHDTV